MEFKNDQEKKKSFSIFKGDELCISRILAREASKGQSSRIFYRSAEGVPFKWETNTGTPNNPQGEDHFFPLSPSPLMQSVGLHLPNADDHGHETKKPGLKRVIISSLRKKIFKKNIISEISNKVGITARNKSGFSSNSSLSMFSSNGHAISTSTIDGPFCCNPLHVHAILDEGSRKIFYCSNHKTTFEVEEDNSFHGRILSKFPAYGQFSGPLDNERIPAGIPFQWEMQPGTPKILQEKELIPPPSPPPAAQSLAMPRPGQLDGGQTSMKYSMWKRDWFCIRKRKKTGNVKNRISCRSHENKEPCGCGEEFEASIQRSSSVSSSSSVVVKMGRSVYGSFLSCSRWSKREILIAKRKFIKSFAS